MAEPQPPQSSAEESPEEPPRKPTFGQWVAALNLPGKSLGTLDWLLGVVERVVALSLSYTIAWRLVHLPEADLATTVKALGEHWQALAIVVVPLFYRVARIFIEKARSGLGLEQETQTTNPPREGR